MLLRTLDSSGVKTVRKGRIGYGFLMVSPLEAALYSPKDYFGFGGDDSSALGDNGRGMYRLYPTAGLS